MHKREFSWSLFVVSVWASFQIMGCCLIGAGIGAASDASKPDEEAVVPLSNIAALERGDSISVTRRDSSALKGKYAGVDTASTLEYAEWYKQRMDSSTSAMFMPSVGDNLTIVTGGTRHNEGQARLIGFDPGVIRVQVNGIPKPAQVRLDTGYKSYIYFGQGKGLAGETLQQYMNAGEIPFMSRALIARDRDTIRIPFDQISQIHQKVSKSGALNGFIYGAAIDVVVVVIAAVVLSSLDFGGLRSIKL